MKKILLLLAISCLTIAAQAQPVLTQSAIGAVGTSYYLGIQDTFAPGYSIGSAGASQNWNMASLLVNDLDTVNFVAPASTQYGSSFPTSNLAIQQSSLNGGYAYMLSSAGGLDLLGVAADVLGLGTPLVLQQTPPSPVATFPFTYLSTYSGIATVDLTVDATSFGIPFVDSARYKNIQDRDLLADGYGNLTLPVGPFSNVLRVKEINNQTDSIWIHTFLGWSLYQDSVYTDSTFTWWNNSRGYFLAQAAYVGGELNTIRYEDPVIVGRPELVVNAFQVYPNPASDRLFIQTDGKAYEIRIVDLQGRVVAQQKLVGALAEVPVTHLERGFYLYTLLDKNGLAKQSGKLLLSR